MASEGLMSDNRTPNVYTLNDEKAATFNKDDDAVDVHTPPPFVGLTKEQLEEYRNDPFWKPLRYVLFVLFWLAWLAMFAAAIVIVLLSPRCPEQHTPQWWENNVCYNAFVPSFKDSDGNGYGDLTGMSNELENLRKINVKTLWASPVLPSDGFNDAVTDYQSVDGQLGSIDDFKALIKGVHDRNLFLVLTLPIATTSLNHEWFKDATTASNYYVWQSTAGSSGYYSQKGTKYYLHVKDHPELPVLNWADASPVKDAILTAIKFWLNLGVDGFYLPNTDYLAGRPPDANAILDTAAQRLGGLEADIQTFANATDALKSNNLLLFTTITNVETEKQLELVNTAGLNYVIHTDLVNFNNASCGPSVQNGACIYKKIKDALKLHEGNDKLHPVWELASSENSRLGSRVDHVHSELLTFLQLCLPGSLNIYYGQELGMKDAPKKVGNISAWKNAYQWNSEANYGFSTITPKVPIAAPGGVSYEDQYTKTHSILKTFKTLASLRQRHETFVSGQFRLGAVSGDAFPFSIARNIGNTTNGEIFIGAVNFGADKATVNFRSDNMIPAGVSLANKIRVAGFTSNSDNLLLRGEVLLTNGTYEIEANQGVLFKI